MADVTKFESKDGNMYEVDGKRYRELSKEPAVGDTVLIVDGRPSESQTYSDGSILTVVEVDGDSDIYVEESEAEDIVICTDEFVIVEPIESETPTPMPCVPYDVFDDIKTKLTRLEERTEENHRNILTFSQTAETARSTASKAIGGVNALDEQLELVREDIVFLDEKIDELEETVKTQGTVQNITININVAGVDMAKEIVESLTKGRE